jgi:hypothetical protein
LLKDGTSQLGLALLKGKKLEYAVLHEVVPQAPLQ